MSVNKDVENMYRKDAEKQRKNQKKKKKNNLITLIILLLIVAGVLFLMNYLGIGFGAGKGGDGDDEGTADRGITAEDPDKEENVDEAKVETEPVSSEETVEYVDITVAGSAFIYNNNVTELEAFLETVDKMNDKVVVRISDDNATQNAMEDLKAALDEKGRNYIIDDTAAETEADAVQ